MDQDPCQHKKMAMNISKIHVPRKNPFLTFCSPFNPLHIVKLFNCKGYRILLKKLYSEFV